MAQKNIIANYFNIFLWGIASFIIYLASLYLAESIVLTTFDYKTEVLKKENLSYSVVTFFIAISTALIIRQIVTESENSLIILIMLWLLAMVIFGLSARVFHYFSKQVLAQDIYQKILGAPLSFSGYILGISIIIMTSFQQEHYDIKSYSLRIILKILLSFLIFPLFIKGLKKLFRMNDHLEYSESSPNANISTAKGIFEGGLFLSAALLTLLIVFNVQFSGLISFR
jgi:uncharacterized membrane protein YjfL (UPF0719 family)